jgi:hypothetical protein
MTDASRLRDLSHREFVKLVQEGKYRILIDPTAAPHLVKTPGVLPNSARIRSFLYFGLCNVLFVIGALLCMRSPLAGGIVIVLALVCIYLQHTSATDILARHALESEKTYLYLVKGNHITLTKKESTRTAPPRDPPRNSDPYRHLPEEVRHARVLGLKGKASMSEVKAAYRTRIAEYHPDKVAHLGPKLKQLAEEECKLINAAYDYFTKKYGRPD